MWHLKHPSIDDLNKYNNLLLPSLMASIDGSNNQPIKNTLLPTMQDGSKDDSILKRLLNATPKELYMLTNQLMNILVAGYNDAEFESYLEAKNTRTINRNPQQVSLYNKYDSILTDLSDIFDYKQKISSNKSRAYTISGIKGRNSCTYCNRQYTQTIVRNGGANNDNRIARPQFDHWFSKELFPLMSLSFFNLIPSCSICNSSAKGNAIFRFNTHVHPYIQTKTNPDFNFSYKAKTNGKWEVDIENATDLRENNMIDDFHLREVYKYHSDLELKDILDFSYANNETYLNTLLNQIMMKFPQKSKEDIYRMFFGTELKEDKFLDRPISKLKFDILKKLGITDIFD